MKIDKKTLRRLILEALSQADINLLASASTGKERKKAYRKLSLKHHPDRGGDENDFKELTSRYKELGGEEDSPPIQQQQQQQQQQSSGDSRVESFIRHFQDTANIASSHTNIFNAINDLELTEIYGHFLLMRYSRDASNALNLYDVAKAYVDRAEFRFPIEHISGLGYDDDYVRWKFRSMMYAKHATKTNNDNFSDIITFAFYSVYEFLKISQQTSQPDTSHPEGFLSAILDNIKKYQNYDRYDKQMHGKHILDSCDRWIDYLGREYEAIFNQYNLKEKLKSMLEYNILTKYNMRRM